MIKIQVKHLRDAADFLQNTLSAKGKKNIDRMRVVKAIEKRLEEVGEEELSILKDYAETKEDGEFDFTESGGIKLEDTKGYNEQIKVLYDEDFVLEGANLQSALGTVEKLVNNYDKDLSGKQAEMHFLLVEAFEEVAVAAKENQEETKKQEDDE